MIELDALKQQALQELSARGGRQPAAPHQSLDALKQQAIESLRMKNPDSQPYSAGQRALQFSRGVASGTGELADMASRGIAHLAETEPMQNLHQFSQDLSKRVSKTPIDPVAYQKAQQQELQALRGTQFEHQLTKPIETLAGRSLKPTEGDTLGEVLHTAGQFMTPIPGVGSAGPVLKTGIKPVLKMLGKEAVGATGSATALTMLPELTEKGSLPNVAEDFAKVVVGGAAGSKALSMANYIKSIAQPKNVSEGLKNSTKMPMDFIAQGFSKIGKPNLRAMELAEKHNIDLPFNVSMKSSIKNFMANTGFKTMFVSDAYKKSLQNADSSVIKAINKSIDTLGDVDYKPTAASKAFADFIKEDEKVFQKQAGQLYDMANEALKPNDVVHPKNTIKAVQDMEEVLSRDVSSPATKRLRGLLTELSDNWGLANDSGKATLGGVDLSDSSSVKKLMTSFNKGKEVEVSPKRLYEIKQEIGEILGHDADVKGKEALLYGINNAIEKDLLASPNSEYVSRLKDARKFFKDNIATRFRTDMARSLMTGEVPKLAFNMMSNPENVKFLGKIAGESSKGKELFESLKKAKLRELMKPAVDGNLQTGKLRAGPFAKIFTKGEKNQELLEELVGKPEYEKLSEIGEVADAFSAAGKELLNTSGSALTIADFDRVKSAAVATVGFFLGSQGAIPALAAAGAYIAAPHYLSKLVSNKEFLNLSNNYARARAMGNEKMAQSILSRLLSVTEQEIKRTGLYQMDKEAKEERE